MTEKNLRGINMATAARIYRTREKMWREVRRNVEGGEGNIREKTRDLSERAFFSPPPAYLTHQTEKILLSLGGDLRRNTPYIYNIGEKQTYIIDGDHV